MANEYRGQIQTVANNLSRFFGLPDATAVLHLIGQHRFLERHSSLSMESFRSLIGQSYCHFEHQKSILEVRGQRGGRCSRLAIPKFLITAQRHLGSRGRLRDFHECALRHLSDCPEFLVISGVNRSFPLSNRRRALFFARALQSLTAPNDEVLHLIVTVSCVVFPRSTFTTEGERLTKNSGTKNSGPAPPPTPP